MAYYCYVCFYKQNSNSILSILIFCLLEKGEVGRYAAWENMEIVLEHQHCLVRPYEYKELCHNNGLLDFKEYGSGYELGGSYYLTKKIYFYTGFPKHSLVTWFYSACYHSQHLWHWPFQQHSLFVWVEGTNVDSAFSKTCSYCFVVWGNQYRIDLFKNRCSYCRWCWENQEWMVMNEFRKRRKWSTCLVQKLSEWKYVLHSSLRNWLNE